MPVRAGVAELQRVVPLGPDLIAVGTRDDTFGAWRGPAWTPAGRFGRADGGGVRSLAVAGGRLYAVAAWPLALDRRRQVMAQRHHAARRRAPGGGRRPR
nr:hypothetical protein GCM10020092_101890 [Actinoplanes digitatis]